MHAPSEFASANLAVQKAIDLALVLSAILDKYGGEITIDKNMLVNADLRYTIETEQKDETIIIKKIKTEKR